MNRYADCTHCGREVVEQTIDYDYRRQKHLMVVSNVPAGVCRQCGEKYFKPAILKRMDSLYHGIFATRSHSEPCRFSQSRNRSSINKSVLNADLIAGGLSPVRPELATLAARRLSF